MLARPLCPVCSAVPDSGPAEIIKDYDLYHCTTCDLVFADPMREPESAWYDAVYTVPHTALDDRIQPYHRWAVRRLPVRGILLDVGCGGGAFVPFARRQGFNAYGIDFSHDAIDAARRRYSRETFFMGTLSDVHRLFPHLLDVVTFFEVLEHVESPAAFLRQVHDVLRPGGFIVMSTPNRARWPIREFGDYPPHHLTRWSERSLRQVLEQAGFHVVRLSTTSRVHSLANFYAYFTRVVLYMALGRYSKGLAAPPSPRGSRLLQWPPIRRAGSILRHARDAVMWIPAVVSFPFLWWTFLGYHLVALAQKPAERDERVGL